MLASGCGGAVSVGDQRARSEDVLSDINSARAEAGLEPLTIDDTLIRTASRRAAAIAKSGEIETDDNPLPRLVEEGCYARFALTHAQRGESEEDATAALTEDPLGRSKVLHPGVTHAGVGVVEGPSKEAFAVVDLARLVDRVDPEAGREALLARIDARRRGNNVEPLEPDAELDAKAQQMATAYMAGEGSSERLIAAAQSEVDGANFALGRVTITFQVTSSLEGAVIPERTTDPALASLGLGLAQGNHAEHEPGSLVVALFLAEPQTAHDARREVSGLPPAKAAPARGKRGGKGSLVDQAWVATLSGNHPKAADLFARAHQQTKQPRLLYESARAHARHGNTDRALEKMRRYAELTEGEERARAEELVGRLERDESIFSQSREDQMSTESKRFFVMGQRLFDQGEWDGAIDAFQQAYVYTKHPDIIYNIGVSHCRAGRIGEALDFFAEYQRYVPEAASVDQARQLFQIGLELYGIGQIEAGSRHFAMAYGYLPLPELVYNLALCHKELGNRDEAVRLLREFLDSSPSKKERAEVERMIEELRE